MKRNSGLDIFRIMCCIGVLNYHVIDDVLGSGDIAYWIYYGSSFCIPGFFLLSGYLIAKKGKLELEYCENKIKSTLTKLFGWIIFWSVICFMITLEIPDIWREFTYGAKASGILPVAWFLFTYSFIMILAYPISWIKNKNRKFFYIVTVIWMTVLTTGIGTDIVNSKPQTLWIHIYLGYFILGMSLYDFKLEKKSYKIAINVVTVCVLILSSAVYIKNYTLGVPYMHYGTWYYSLWLMSIFILVSQIKIPNETSSMALKTIGSNTFAIYLGHLPILLYFTQIRNLENAHEAIWVVIVLFVVLNLLAELFKRLPLLRKIV